MKIRARAEAATQSREDDLRQQQASIGSWTRRDADLGIGSLHDPCMCKWRIVSWQNKNLEGALK